MLKVFGGTRKITCLILELLVGYFSGKLVRNEMFLQEGSAKSRVSSCAYLRVSLTTDTSYIHSYVSYRGRIVYQNLASIRYRTLVHFEYFHCKLLHNCRSKLHQASKYISYIQADLKQTSPSPAFLNRGTYSILVPIESSQMTYLFQTVDQP